jgi:Sec-independent protein translocase protein TatA
MIGPSEILIVAAAILFLIKGPAFVKEMASSLGQAQKNYKEGKKGAEEIQEDAEEAVNSQ